MNLHDVVLLHKCFTNNSFPIVYFLFTTAMKDFGFLAIFMVIWLLLLLLYFFNAHI